MSPQYFLFPQHSFVLTQIRGRESLFSDEQMMKDGLAASHFQLLAAKLGHSIINLWCFKLGN